MVLSHLLNLRMREFNDPEMRQGMIVVTFLLQKLQLLFKSLASLQESHLSC
jgi:hypothetical protein